MVIVLTSDEHLPHAVTLGSCKEAGGVQLANLITWVMHLKPVIMHLHMAVAPSCHWNQPQEFRAPPLALGRLHRVARRTSIELPPTKAAAVH